MEIINKNLILTPTKDNKFVVVKDVVIQGILIPKNYKTNGADIPRAFWFLIPPFKPKFLSAVILHDYVCDLEEYKKADILFQKELYKIEKRFITKAIVFSVKTYHKFKYKVK